MLLETIALSTLLAASSSTPAPIASETNTDNIEEIKAAGITLETPLFRVGPATGGDR